MLGRMLESVFVRASVRAGTDSRSYAQTRAAFSWQGAGIARPGGCALSGHVQRRNGLWMGPQPLRSVHTDLPAEVAEPHLREHASPSVMPLLICAGQLGIGHMRDMWAPQQVHTTYAQSVREHVHVRARARARVRVRVRGLCVTVRFTCMLHL